jgi:hypothetical protein
MSQSTSSAGEQQPPAPLRRASILFIGNSLTYFNDGIYSHLERLAASAVPPLVIRTDKAVHGGAYFKTLWDAYAEPRAAIARGGHDVVVLQEDLPETAVADFRVYARHFVGATREAGAKPVLLMAWPYQRLGWISMDEIAQAHRDAATELGADVAPVGLAWARANVDRPALDLFLGDREHPNVHGTYLATCVVYATIFKRDPTPLTYLPAGISADEGRFLRSVAWATVTAFATNK